LRIGLAGRKTSTGTLAKGDAKSVSHRLVEARHSRRPVRGANPLGKTYESKDELSPRGTPRSHYG